MSDDPSCSSDNNTNSSNDCDSGNFECNICLDLAQDPIVTLCGHLFCWPCLYKWLHLHSQSKECPVCKALIEEDRLVPLYGRGKSSADPRSKSIPGLEVPNRPSGQRPETALPPDPNHGFAHHHHGFGGFMGGFAAPMASARFGNVTLSATFGGLIPSLFNLHFHGFPNAAMYGAAASGSFPHGFSNPFHGGGHSHMHSYQRHTGLDRQQDHHLKILFLVLLVVLVFSLILG
ncbi:PREDICTED: RING finger protein 5-like [Camelina sativa]|uniref:E3 ubiquitin-protein ligase RMA n=1 Tax=Camelina sativa TaxID=90675 RepID=A0ABM0VQB4_CAMSA|nr:PREDICTED: RING finger protein 5-like [Camelina sativa]